MLKRVHYGVPGAAVGVLGVGSMVERIQNIGSASMRAHCTMRGLGVTAGCAGGGTWDGHPAGAAPHRAARRAGPGSAGGHAVVLVGVVDDLQPGGANMGGQASTAPQMAASSHHSAAPGALG
jgi:hypothetical protein